MYSEFFSPKTSEANAGRTSSNQAKNGTFLRRPKYIGLYDPESFHSLGDHISPPTLLYTFF